MAAAGGLRPPTLKASPPPTTPHAHRAPAYRHGEWWRQWGERLWPLRREYAAPRPSASNARARPRVSWVYTQQHRPRCPAVERGGGVASRARGDAGRPPAGDSLPRWQATHVHKTLIPIAALRPPSSPPPPPLSPLLLLLPTTAAVAATNPTRLWWWRRDAHGTHRHADVGFFFFFVTVFFCTHPPRPTPPQHTVGGEPILRALSTHQHTTRRGRGDFRPTLHMQVQHRCARRHPPHQSTASGRSAYFG